MALAASLYQQIQIDKPAVPDAEMAGPCPGHQGFRQRTRVAARHGLCGPADAPAGRPRINAIRVPKARVQQLADAVNGVATLEAIVSDELAMTALYEADRTVRMLLWQPRGQELQLLVFSSGGPLLLPVSSAGSPASPVPRPDQEMLDGLALEIQRSLDYLAGHLKLPGRIDLQLAIASSAIRLLVRHLEQVFGFPVSAMPATRRCWPVSNTSVPMVRPWEANDEPGC